MTGSYELTKLGPNSFEHLVTLLALRVLGAGHTGFGPGPDGGRDGFFEGEAPYPSEVEHWKGRWYLQAKFHEPHLSSDPQKWLIARIEEELTAFQRTDSNRKWPDNWIVATNIDPSGIPTTGAFDKTRLLVRQARPQLARRFHIWGGRKILDLLAVHPEVADYYRDFLTPGQIFTALYDDIKDSRAELETILRFLIVRQFSEQQFTRLEQAGSDADTRPGIHKLYIDLPFRAHSYDLNGMLTQCLVRTAANCHRYERPQPDTPEWRTWHRHPVRARAWFMKGGPGQGKSTAGQYFCQLQRAALILQDDCFPVSVQAKTLAEEVRVSATPLGFWPAVPRIPVSIELRDYAQWFGQRAKDEPRGVLTFLATRLAAGVEQPVSVGILRRALSSRSWFVTFDGLDEVPHDVKDGVASEVIHFLNDVAIDTRSDLVSLCTSRPQGYSGQFNELDAPTIDLTPLSPDQALRCAAPVLALGRSEPEAAKYFQILRSAIESGSVRELMTSPLQSHIMAVVVRDGGKPPERRWQLYSNFYQVIKRREANRDLPDRRLAKLLREDTQLLKSVHNRLGFLLHALAETSRGAQTRLDRDGFKTLLVRAVSEMIEEDIAGTVGVLMDATTNRLVLVNTPDDGDHVRFDIRPLQEFFAAEFLYESINADELRRRMEIVSGDAHWREVMHFLLSALVENGRLTELSVAVEVLERLNSGNGETETRLVSRRIGRGALLVARLLVEGVLEQDKRIRQQFRKCLEPITAFVDSPYLDSFDSLRAPNSAIWFVSFLIDALREADRTESVGAGILLLRALKDGHPRVAEIQTILLSSPPDYLVAILQALLDDTAKHASLDSPHVSEWVLETIVKLLVRSDWTSLGLDGVRVIHRILQRAGKRSFTVATACGLTALQVRLLQVFVTEESKPRAEANTTDYGILTGALLPADWTNARVATGEWWTDLPYDLGDPTPGVLGLIHSIGKFSKTPSMPNLKEILDCIPGDAVRILRSLPSSVQALVPYEGAWDSPSDIQRLQSLSEDGLQTLLTESLLDGRKIGRPHAVLSLGTGCDLNQWQRLVNDMPRIAVQVWSEHLWERVALSRRPEILDQPEAVEILVNKVIQDPNVIRSFPGLWGKFLKLAPRQRTELREAFLAASTSSRVGTHWDDSFHPFSLNLPFEADLMPNLVAALVHHFRTRPDGTHVRHDVGTFVAELVNDPAVLAGIASDSRSNVSTIAAAVILRLLHPRSRATLSEHREALIRCYSPGIGVWYFQAVSFCITQLGSEHDDASRMIVGSLLDSARADYSGRIELQRLLTRWRETSYAPVNQANVLQQWLDGV